MFNIVWNNDWNRVKKNHYKSTKWSFSDSKVQTRLTDFDDSKSQKGLMEKSPISYDKKVYVYFWPLTLDIWKICQ